MELGTKTGVKSEGANRGERRIEPGSVRLRVVRADGDYGEATASAAAAVGAAADCGLDLEPTYTGKTLAVLLTEEADRAMLLNTYAGSSAGTGSLF